MDREMEESRSARDSADRFQQIVREHLAQVRGVVYNILLNRDDTDDVTQETFIAAYQNFERFRGDSALSTWLCGIAVRKACTLVRTRDRQRRLLDQAPVNPASRPPGHDLMQAEEMACVDAAMARLPIELRSVLVLSTIEGYPGDEVAEICGCTRTTVYWRLHKARKLLKRYLNDEGIRS